METLKEQGRPNHRLYYNKVREIERPDARTVRFLFETETPDRELPLILGLMPIVSKDYYSSVTFEETTLTPRSAAAPTGSRASTRAAASSTAAIPTTGGGTCRSTAG